VIVARTIADLQQQLTAARAAGKSVGLVPTMGALHDGHRHLLDKAAEENDVVVVSVFVNPTQFNDAADLAAYPRTEPADRALAEAAGVSVYFAPAASEMYPPGFRTTVALSGPLVEGFEGAQRGASHFNGVTTVVTKLLTINRPDRAYFGQKDAQQLRVVRALVVDLNLDVDIVAVPTVREPDGLARSSRNVRLSIADREHALGLSRALFAAQALFESGVRDAAKLLAAGRAVLADHDIDPEYLAVVDGSTFEPVDHVGGVSAGTGGRTHGSAEATESSAGGEAVLVVAATVGSTRLIDNVVLAG
jgi:pantoate--beta-alanine ligase